MTDQSNPNETEPLTLYTYINTLHALELLNIIKSLSNKQIDFHAKEALTVASNNLMNLSYKFSKIPLSGNIKILFDKFLKDDSGSCGELEESNNDNISDCESINSPEVVEVSNSAAHYSGTNTLYNYCQSYSTSVNKKYSKPYISNICTKTYPFNSCSDGEYLDEKSENSGNISMDYNTDLDLYEDIKSGEKDIITKNMRKVNYRTRSGRKVKPVKYFY